MWHREDGRAGQGEADGCRNGEHDAARDRPPEVVGALAAGEHAQRGQRDRRPEPRRDHRAGEDPSAPRRRVQREAAGGEGRERETSSRTRARFERLDGGPHGPERQDDVPDVVVAAGAPPEEERIDADRDRRDEAGERSREPPPDRERGDDAGERDQHRHPVDARREWDAGIERVEHAMDRHDRRDVERARVAHRRAHRRVRVRVATLAADHGVAGRARPQDVPRVTREEVAVVVAEIHVLPAVGATMAELVAHRRREGGERERKEPHPQHDRRGDDGEGRREHAEPLGPYYGGIVAARGARADAHARRVASAGNPSARRARWRNSSLRARSSS